MAHTTSKAQHDFASHFVEAALFADTPYGYDIHAEGKGLASEIALRAFAAKFYDAHENDIHEYSEGLDGAAHDLWYTVNGHGCGYWEQDDEVSKRLDAAAQELRGSEGLYEGDDGLLYWAY